MEEGEMGVSSINRQRFLGEEGLALKLQGQVEERVFEERMIT